MGDADDWLKCGKLNYTREQESRTDDVHLDRILLHRRLLRHLRDHHELFPGAASSGDHGARAPPGVCSQTRPCEALAGAHKPRSGALTAFRRSSVIMSFERFRLTVWLGIAATVMLGGTAMSLP
jgi:hypothetical protein